MDAYDQDDEPDTDRESSSADARRLITLALAGLAIIGFIVALGAVEPWTHVVDDEGVEPFAGTRTPSEAARASLGETVDDLRRGHDPLEPAEVAESGRAVFEGRDGHAVEGQARIVELADGQRVVRLEGLALDGGPGLAVYLTPTPIDAPTGEFIDGAVSLGELVYHEGDSNYVVPADVDPDAYRSVTIWSDPTGVNFAVAGFR
jgi:hypothetical protein